MAPPDGSSASIGSVRLGDETTDAFVGVHALELAQRTTEAVDKIRREIAAAIDPF
jgi:hypothetical protein